MITLDEVIKHAEEKAEEQQLLAYNLKQCKDYGNPKSTIIRGVIECETCADEHRQLAEWLKDYKRLKEQEPSEDCVSRANLLKKFEDRFIELQKAHRKDTQLGVNWCINTLKDMPPVTPTRKKGKWVDRWDKIFLCENKNCSICGHTAQTTYNYCPNCGAEMEKGWNNG